MISSIKAITLVATRFSIAKSAFSFQSFQLTPQKVLTPMSQVISQRAYCQIPDSLPQQGNSGVDRIYVYHDEQKDLLKISFEYEKNGKSKRFNLHRNINENLAGSLERIRLNIAKLSRNKKTKLAPEAKGDQSETELKFELDGTSIDPEFTKNIDAWVDGASLKLDGRLYKVKLNEPQVVLLILPTPIMKGFVSIPNVSLANCRINNCLFTWYRMISREERDKLLDQDESLESSVGLDGGVYWLKLVDSLTYTPVEDDIAHHLKVVCHPSNGKDWGLVCSTTSSSSVELGPEECPFEKRHELTKDEVNQTNHFRFVTYNILADVYADSDYSRTVLFAQCPPYALGIGYRRQLLLKELYGYKADIICLQEVDRKEFIGTYEPFFQMASGHSGVFANKGGQICEGVAIFYRNDRFNLIDSHKITLAKLVDPISKIDDSDKSTHKSTTESEVDQNMAHESSTKRAKVDQSDLRYHPILNDLETSESIELLSKFNTIRDKIFSHQPLKRRFLGLHTVLQTSLLQSKDSPKTFVIVANTHLYFAPDADHIRLLQGSVCVKYLEFIKEYYRRKIEQDTGASDVKLNIIFCGDMNSSPDCGLFNLLQSGKAGSELADWHSNEEEAVQGLEIETHLRFKSAYQDIPYTNYTLGFNGCLDYIYYELDGFTCEKTVPLPDHDDVISIGGLPSLVFPSDHLALIANLKFN